MSKSKSKLGHNPLAPRGVGAFFADPAPLERAMTQTSPDPLYAQPSKPTEQTTKLSGAKSVSHLVNKVTTPSAADEVLERHTFYITEAQAQKVKLYALLHRMQISEVIRMLVDNHLKIQP
jgi:hypothetical protein